ncbi:IS3 family transposase [Bacillus toyonensis]
MSSNFWSYNNKRFQKKLNNLSSVDFRTKVA